LEKNVDRVENETSCVGSISCTFKFDNIGGFDAFDGLLGSFKSRKGSSKFFVGLFLFKSDGVLLNDTSLSDSSYFLSFNVGLLVFNFKFSKQCGCLFSGNLESCVFFLKTDLEFVNTSCGLSELFKTVVDVLFFDVNAFELLNVDVLVHSNEGEIGLGSDIHISTHLLEVNTANFSYHVVNLTHVDDKSVLNSLCVFNLEGLEELF